MKESDESARPSCRNPRRNDRENDRSREQSTSDEKRGREKQVLLVDEDNVLPLSNYPACRRVASI